VATYDLKPEMSAFEVTDVLVDKIGSGEYDFIVINYANSDMVGHTGIMEAAVAAVEAVDKCVGKVYDAVLEAGAQMFLCADHGNSEQMEDPKTGAPYTAHTTNPVPFVLINANESFGLKTGGKLCDIAPTLLDIMEIPIPAQMTGRSLIKRS
ncbi:MAG: alkaline phosphatase family protein, partial [Firmicutes bacterium]|nr:alkaline phosphatase family protein [Bacillota bacterium]